MQKLLNIFVVFLLLISTQAMAKKKKHNKKKEILYQCLKAVDYLTYKYNDKAWEILKQYEDLAKKNFCIAKYLGIYFYRVYKDDKAIKYFNYALKINENSPYIYDTLGLIYKNKGLYQKAAEYFKKACDLGFKVSCSDYETYKNKPDSLKAGGSKGGNLYDLSKYEKGSSEYYYYEGENFKKLGKYDKAIESFKKAIEVDPNNKKAQNALGYELEMKGKYNEAIKHYQKACTIDPKYSQAWVNLGYAARSAKKLSLSYKAFKKACELGNSSGCANMKNLVNSNPDLEIKAIEDLVQKGKYDEAFKALSKSLEKNPVNPYTHLNIGKVYFKIKKYYPAVLHLKKAIEYHPTLAEAYRLLVLAYMKLDDDDNAEKYWKIYCKIQSKKACKELEKEADL